MKKARRSKKTYTKKKKRVKKAEKQNSRLFLFALLVLFSVSTGVSYVYFKPVLSFESSVDTVSEGYPANRGKDKKEASQRLYKFNRDKEETWYDSEFRNDASIANLENVIKRYIKTYKAKVLDLYMDKEGIVYVDFSKSIKNNFKGDVSEELELVAGLYRVIRTSIPDFQGVKIIVEGKETETLGGHIDISRPVGEEIEGSGDRI